MASILKRFNVEEEVDLEAKKYLTFLIDKQFYAFPIRDVLSIIEVQEVIAVPEFPSYVKGIINLRGQIIPIIDVRLRFRKEEAAYTERTCFIVVTINDVNIGFVVDTVDEVIGIEDENISPPPAMATDGAARYLMGVGKIEGKIVLLLDAKKMLNDDELSSLAGRVA